MQGLVSTLPFLREAFWVSVRFFGVFFWGGCWVRVMLSSPGQDPEPPPPACSRPRAAVWGIFFNFFFNFWCRLKVVRVLGGGVAALAHTDFLLGCIFSKANPSITQRFKQNCEVSKCALKRRRKKKKDAGYGGRRREARMVQVKAGTHAAQTGLVLAGAKGGGGADLNAIATTHES